MTEEKEEGNVRPPESISTSSTPIEDETESFVMESGLIGVLFRPGIKVIEDDE